MAIKYYFLRLGYRRAAEMEEIKEGRLDRLERMKMNKLKEFDEHEKIQKNEALFRTLTRFL